ncbi:MAG: CPBP family intramembrane metalloprotease [Eubacterium sp.]|nr:CPBP family intramembrane metalloprotease [Eubacterium sp.]
MSKIKNSLKNISPLNNRTEMPVILYIIKVIIIFWFVKFGSELIGEAIVIGLHFACGKNPLKGEMFDGNTIMLISYYGYGLMIVIMFLYWKLFQKKTLAELGFTKKAFTYLAGVLAGIVLIVVSVVSVGFTGALTFNGVFSKIDHIHIILMLGGFICQGAMEEVLCRGIVLQLLKDRTPIPVAVGISTALFTIPHMINMAGASTGINRYK